MRFRLPLLCALTAMLAACGNKQPSGDAAGPSSAAAATSTAVATASTNASPSATTVASGATEAHQQPLNVLLITIDSMRADMPWQGYERPIAPNLTKLAAESVVYENAYSVSSYTAKSVGALLSGRYPSTLWRGHTFFTQYSKANVFFPELLQQGGVRTMAGHAHLYFDRKKNLSQGFDVWKLTPGLTWNASTDESITSDKMTELAKGMLSAENTKGPFFMWLHYMDPHDLYMLHEGGPSWGRNNRDRYDGEMFFTDQHVGALLDFVKQQPWADRTAIVISADHGEAFGEHKMFKHGFALWELLTRVPLMVKLPGGAPMRIKQRRSHIDLAPTILELMDQPANPGFAGKSLVAELTGRAKPDNREPILLELPADSHNPPTKAFIKGDFKLIIDEAAPRYRLFNLANDPDELRDLAKDHSFKDKLAEMKKRAEDAWSKHPLVKPFGGKKVVGGMRANGPEGPDGYQDDGKRLP